MHKVIKFGGSTLKNTPNIVHHVNKTSVFVVSAVAGMTNALLRGDKVSAAEIFRSWMRKNGIRYTETIDACIDTMFSMPAKSPICVSYGEKLTAVAISEMLNRRKTDAVPLFADSFMFADGGTEYDSNLMDECKVEQLHNLLEKGITPVITGYCARNLQNKTVLLGRDGSDITAAYLANKMNFDCYIITDVDGIMTCDPRIVPAARTIPYMSKEEARELAFYGANILHRKTLDAVGHSSLHILNIRGYGTTIQSQEESLGKPIAIALLFNRRAVTVSAEATPGFCAKVFTALSKKNISVEMLLQTCSETEVSVVVPDWNCEVCGLVMSQFGHVSISEMLGIVTMVGDGMSKTVGIASSIFTKLSNNNINVRCVSQGPSERSLSIAVSISDLKKAANVLHETL